MGSVARLRRSPLTRGARLLKEKLGAKDLSQAEFTRRLGLQGGVVNRWLRGSRRPEPHLREAIHRLLKIKVEEWFTDDEFLIAFDKPRAESEKLAAAKAG